LRHDGVLGSTETSAAARCSTAITRTSRRRLLRCMAVRPAAAPTADEGPPVPGPRQAAVWLGRLGRRHRPATRRHPRTPAAAPGLPARDPERELQRVLAGKELSMEKTDVQGRVDLARKQKVTEFHTSPGHPTSRRGRRRRHMPPAQQSQLPVRAARAPGRAAGWVVSEHRTAGEPDPTPARGTLVDSRSARLGWPDHPRRSVLGHRRWPSPASTTPAGSMSRESGRHRRTSRRAHTGPRRVRVLVPRVNSDWQRVAGLRGVGSRPRSAPTPVNLRRAGSPKGEECGLNGSS